MKRSSAQLGCSLEARRGKLRLRFRVKTRAGLRHVSRDLGLENTPENRRAAAPLAQMVGAALKSGRRLADIDRMLGRLPEADAPAGTRTVEQFYAEWIAERRGIVKKSRAQKYETHFDCHVLPALGEIPLGNLRASDVRAFRSTLLQKVAVKTAKNVMSSFRAMVRAATGDDLVSRDLFLGLDWPKVEQGEPDPFTIAERQRIVAWFADSEFGFRPRKGEYAVKMASHPSFHAFVLTLFSTGLRPSEAAGLQWGDIDLRRARLYVRRSRSMYEDGATKTARARRTVELFPAVVSVLAALKPHGAGPKDRVFTNTTGQPIEPKQFGEDHWNRALVALKIRHRGLYSTKDTFVSEALTLGCKIPWVEEQTGVDYATLRRHYGKWMHSETESELTRFEKIDPGLFSPAPGPRIVPQGPETGEKSVRGGGLEPRRSRVKTRSILGLNPHPRPAKRANLAPWVSRRRWA